MGDNLRRKCFKCGLSPSEDQDIKLYRFPKPGNTNVRRCEAWAKFSLPDCPWSSADFRHLLYKEHRMLCNKHFKQSEFIDFTEKKLHKHAVPDTDIYKTVPVHEKPSVLISKCDHSTKSCKDFELLKKCKQNLKKICQLKKKIKSLKNQTL